MRSNTKACQYKSITQCNLSQQDLVLECLEGLRFFYTQLGLHQARAPGEDGIVYIHACLSDIMKLQIIAHQLRSPKCCSCSQGPGVTFAGTATTAL